MKRLSVFPIIRKGEWLFRTSIIDSNSIMIFAFNPHNQQMLIRFYFDELNAKAFVDECAEGKHVD